MMAIVNECKHFDANMFTFHLRDDGFRRRFAKKVRVSPNPADRSFENRSAPDVNRIHMARRVSVLLSLLNNYSIFRSCLLPL
jgi:hypothetical protein